MRYDHRWAVVQRHATSPKSTVVMVFLTHREARARAIACADGEHFYSTQRVGVDEPLTLDVVTQGEWDRRVASGRPVSGKRPKWDHGPTIPHPPLARLCGESEETHERC